jgi:hypothetical protein
LVVSIQSSIRNEPQLGESPLRQQLERARRDASAACRRADDVPDLALPRLFFDLDEEAEPQERPLLGLDREPGPRPPAPPVLVDPDPLAGKAGARMRRHACVPAHGIVLNQPCNVRLVIAGERDEPNCLVREQRKRPPARHRTNVSAGLETVTPSQG